MASPAMASPPPAARLRTMADLQEHLWGIPAYRIRLIPPPGQATEQDLLDVQAKEDRTCELIDGILVEKPMATFESRLAACLIFFLELYLTRRKLGAVLDGSGFLRLVHGRVRAPDVSFISWKQIRGRRFPEEPISSLYPDLAVEVMSESNTAAEMRRKLVEYFEAGARLVWYVYPTTRTVHVWTSPSRHKVLGLRDSLDGGKVLPGFKLSIKKWFDRASLKP